MVRSTIEFDNWSNLFSVCMATTVDQEYSPYGLYVKNKELMGNGRLYAEFTLKQTEHPCRSS